MAPDSMAAVFATLLVLLFYLLPLPLIDSTVVTYDTESSLVFDSALEVTLRLRNICQPVSFLHCCCTIERYGGPPLHVAPVIARAKYTVCQQGAFASCPATTKAKP